MYGRELFELLGFPDAWDEFLAHLKEWKLTIPDLPEVNMDLDVNATAVALVDVKSGVWNKFFSNPSIVEEIAPIVFPSGEALEVLIEFHKKRASKESMKVVRTLSSYLNSRKSER